MEETKHPLDDVQAGSRVVMQNRRREDVGVRTVSRLTSTQIILSPEGTYDRYYRADARAGISIERGSQHIDRLATQAEIDHFEAIESAKRTERERLEFAEDVRSAGNRIASAAQDMQQAANTIELALDRHRQFMDDWLFRFNEALALFARSQER